MTSEFTIFIPQIPPEARYVISGPDCQILTVNLKPGQTLESEPASMMYMHPSIHQEIGCGSLTRCCTGESCCKVKYTNSSGSDAYVGVTAAYPSKIIPIDLSTVGGSFILRGGSYVSAVEDVNIIADCACFNCPSYFGGVGILRQGAVGNGTIFVSGGGTVMSRNLAAGEQIVVGSEAIVGWQNSVTLGVRLTGGFGALCFGGEGCCYSTLTGPGLVILESMPFSKYMAAIAPPSRGSDSSSSSE